MNKKLLSQILRGEFDSPATRRGECLGINPKAFMLEENQTGENGGGCGVEEPRLNAPHAVRPRGSVTNLPDQLGPSLILDVCRL